MESATKRQREAEVTQIKAEADQKVALAEAGAKAAEARATVAEARLAAIEGLPRASPGAAAVRAVKVDPAAAAAASGAKVPEADAPAPNAERLAELEALRAAQSASLEGRLRAFDAHRTAQACAAHEALEVRKRRGRRTCEQARAPFPIAPPPQQR